MFFDNTTHYVLSLSDIDLFPSELQPENRVCWSWTDRLTDQHIDGQTKNKVSSNVIQSSMV